MFQSIGWGEIFIVMIFALIIIGPERLPKVITDVRAAIFAARKAINNAKKEMDGEFGAEFEEFKKPIAEVAKWRSMTPRAALTHALFNDDEGFLDSFDPKKIMSQDTAGQAYREAHPEAQAAAATPGAAHATEEQGSQADGAKAAAEPTAGPGPEPQTVEKRRLGSARAQFGQPAPRPAAPEPGGFDAVGGFSWDDIM